MSLMHQRAKPMRSRVSSMPLCATFAREARSFAARRASFAR
jgi:hypothetical protein